MAASGVENRRGRLLGLGVRFALPNDRMTPPLAPASDVGVPDGVNTRAESMTALAGLLLDWRVDCERHLRSLTCMQRWLERVRSGTAGDGECDLLIQEIGRLLRETPPNHEEWTRRAETYLNRTT